MVAWAERISPLAACRLDSPPPLATVANWVHGTSMYQHAPAVVHWRTFSLKQNFCTTRLSNDRVDVCCTILSSLLRRLGKQSGDYAPLTGAESRSSHHSHLHMCSLKVPEPPPGDLVYPQDIAFIFRVTARVYRITRSWMVHEVAVCNAMCHYCFHNPPP